MKYRFLFFIMLPALCLNAQEEPKNWEFNGYVSLMGSHKKEIADTLIFPGGENSHKDALIHNRLNFFWYPNESFTFSVQARNRIIYDETISENPGIDKLYEHDGGLISMSKNWFAEDDYIFNSNIDRLYVQYTLGNFEISAGRQRINWSQSYAWNPNDIFNASNYFDFDYPEKPGSDALRLQYYTGMLSSAQAVVKLDDKNNITAAGLFRFNLKGYDIQLLSGVVNEEEVVLGSGWSGNIKQIGFRGEVTSLFPYKDTSEYMHGMDNLFMADLSFDYVFPNSASVLCEFLYANNDIESLASSFTSLFSSPVTIRSLAFSRLSTLVSGTYPVHPLINVSVSGMFFYRITGMYFGSNVDFSLTDNLSLSAFVQYFNMFLSKEDVIQLDDMSIRYLFLRMKYNF